MSAPVPELTTAVESGPLDPALAKQIAGRSPTQIALQRLRHDKVSMFSAAVVLMFVVIALAAPIICGIFGVELRAGDPVRDTNIYNFPKIGPPIHGFIWSHPLGLEPNTGNDLTAEWVYGSRTSLEVASLATILSTIIGVILGLLAGFSRGWLDRVLTFIIDVFLSLPFLLCALAMAPILINRFGASPGALNRAQFLGLVGILTFFGWMGLARLIRGEVFSLREREFVQAARVIGVPTRSVLFKELLPNMLAPIIVSISLNLPAYVSLEAGLSYLGIGLTGRPSWGQTINRAQGFFDTYPLYLWAPVVGIMVLVVALNLLGDGVRDAFDPKTRR